MSIAIFDDYVCTIGEDKESIDIYTHDLKIRKNKRMYTHIKKIQKFDEDSFIFLTEGLYHFVSVKNSFENIDTIFTRSLVLLEDSYYIIDFVVSGSKVIGIMDHSFFVWNNFEEPTTYTNFEYKYTAVFCPSNRKIYIQCKNYQLRIFDINTREFSNYPLKTQIKDIQYDHKNKEYILTNEKLFGPNICESFVGNHRFLILSNNRVGLFSKINEQEIIDIKQLNANILVYTTKDGVRLADISMFYKPLHVIKGKDIHFYFR